MKQLICSILLFVAVLSGYSLTAFSAPKCQQYEFYYQIVPGKNTLSYQVQTENYEHPTTFAIDQNNTLMKGVPGTILGFSLIGRDAQGKVLLHCIYGLNGAVMQNPDETMTCPKTNEEIDNDNGNKICQFFLPSNG
jgi:hypothetical protein